jgi:hypothetical protein
MLASAIVEREHVMDAFVVDMLLATLMSYIYKQTSLGAQTHSRHPLTKTYI